MSRILVLFFLFLSLGIALINGVSSNNERKPYIVYMGGVPDAPAHSFVVHQHNRLLEGVIGDVHIAREAKIHSYGKSFNGFAARLLPHEVERLSNEDSVVSVFPSTKNKLHTTRSWDFVGMTGTIKRRAEVESNVIVGILDTGIYIDAPSFKDDDLGPPPGKWKGKCMTGPNFTGCNNKVIGAKYFNLENLDDPDMGDLSPADDEGHGTHTSSTAAGVAVKDASLYGIAKGTARGGVPSARIAMYKVCWGDGCTDTDMLAGFDEAIADGVDILSVSIGGTPRDFFEDPIAIGSFHAMKYGILTACSGGNDGPYWRTVQNVAPWILTVAANSIDRQFKTTVKLGNGMKATGMSINTITPKKKMYPLTNGARATNLTKGSYGNFSACDYGTLSMEKVKGKIVYCAGDYSQDYNIEELKGVGVIMSTDTETDIAFTSIIPAAEVNLKDGHNIDKYINTTKNPVAVIYKTRTANASAPFLASFSSRGPQPFDINILKPDVSAPGLDILAAYSKLTSVTGDPSDHRYSVFNIISGTSMSCPHVAAAAVYVKSFHPDWSASAVKSALMTTATKLKIQGAEDELGTGSGQIHPPKALHPGLIYDISMEDYISFLCKHGYNNTEIGLIYGGKKKINCSDFKSAQDADGLNYPSMHIQLRNPGSSIEAVFYRTVTNVGFGSSVYKANVTSPKGVSITVEPDTLRFDKSHQKRDFRVTVKGGPMKKGNVVLSGLLEWNDSKHRVRSPIVIFRDSEGLVV